MMHAKVACGNSGCLEGTADVASVSGGYDSGARPVYYVSSDGTYGRSLKALRVLTIPSIMSQYVDFTAFFTCDLNKAMVERNGGFMERPLRIQKWFFLFLYCMYCKLYPD